MAIFVTITYTFFESANKYNKSHIMTCNTIERCFGVLKRCCPCLQKGINLKKTSTVLQVFVAAAVLHNICIESDEIEPPNDLLVDLEDPPDILRTGLSSLRSAIVNNVFT